MKVMLLSLAAIWTLASPVYAQVPTWHVDVSCKGAVAADRASNLDDVQPMDICIKDEADAREQLTKIWTSFPAPLRTRCEGEASMNNLPSYVDLLVCLQISDPAATPVSLKGAGKNRAKPPARGG